MYLLGEPLPNVPTKIWLFRYLLNSGLTCRGYKHYTSINCTCYYYLRLIGVSKKKQIYLVYKFKTFYNAIDVVGQVHTCIWKPPFKVGTLFTSVEYLLNLLSWVIFLGATRQYEFHYGFTPCHLPYKSARHITPSNLAVSFVMTPDGRSRAKHE